METLLYQQLAVDSKLPTTTAPRPGKKRARTHFTVDVRRMERERGVLLPCVAAVVGRGVSWTSLCSGRVKVQCEREMSGSGGSQHSGDTSPS